MKLFFNLTFFDWPLLEAHLVNVINELNNIRSKIMADENKPKGFEWIKSHETGTSYLCPVGSIADKTQATDEDLKKVCVDESDNPQND